MVKPDKMDIADLLSDESFINYCKKSSPKDIAWWESYLQENPDQRLLIEHAKGTFIQLFNALAEADRDEQESRLKNMLNLMDSTQIVPLDGVEKKKNSYSLPWLLKITAAAAVLVAAVFFTIQYYNNGTIGNLKSYYAAYGERKDIQLPDGSVVTLNGGSKIEIPESFGVSTRDLYLEGEAFFDVKHNKDLPFIVHTPAMDVKALGTAFNVKAYPMEKITEAALVRGLVEVTLKEGNNRKMLLHPNQKIHWIQADAKVSDSKGSRVKNSGQLNATDSLMKPLVATDAGDIKEIAWKQNKLIFEDESFEDLAVLLERWYGVKISIKDAAIRNYRFTGLFEKEELSTVLNLLKESKSFNYEIEPGETLKINIFK